MEGNSSPNKRANQLLQNDKDISNFSNIAMMNGRMMNKKLVNKKTQSNIKNNNNNNNNNDVTNYKNNLDDWLDNCLKDNQNIMVTPSTPEQMITHNFPNMMINGFINKNSMLPTHKYRNSYSNLLNVNELQQNANTDFTSLPPGVNLTDDYNIDNGDDDVDEYETSQHLLNVEYDQNARFSIDPCLNNEMHHEMDLNSLKDMRHFQKTTASSTPVNSSNNNGNSNGRDNSKILATLLEQINLLHDTNSKICKNLHETKVELEALKHAPNWSLRHRRDSISGLSTHSQPLGHVFVGGAQSPASTYHSGMYMPGMLTDVVREIREAARIREEALIQRVKALVDERSWTLNDSNMKMVHDVEEIKAQVQQLKNNNRETKSRVTKLEDDMIALKRFLSHKNTNNNLNPSSPILYESNDPFLIMRENSENNKLRSKRNSLTINYGKINKDDNFNEIYSDNDMRSFLNQNKNDKSPLHQNCNINNEQIMLQNRYSASPQHNGGGNSLSNIINSSSHNSTNNMFNLPEHEKSFEANEQLVQLEHDKLELRRELQDALASKKVAEGRILALERMVNNLSIKITNVVPDEQQHQNLNSSNQQSTATVSGTTISVSKENLINNNQNQHHIANTIQTISPNQITNNGFCLSGPITDL